MSEVRKRSRKSKLEVRDTDEYEIVNQLTDDSPLLQKVPRTIKVEYPAERIIFDHDYCQRGSQSFAQAFPVPSILRPAQRLAIDELSDIENLYRDKTIHGMAAKYKRNKYKNRGEVIKLCKYDPTTLLHVSKEISSTSLNPADKLLDIEMRNLWGSVLSTHHEVDTHETLLQMTFELWQAWFNTGKITRGSPLFYQCHICHLAWWRLQPFRNHIKTHDIKTLRISLKENIHECMIIASTEVVKKLIFIDIEEDCWKCGKDVAFHKEMSENYACTRCKKTHYTCEAWRSHETKCLYSNISIHNVAKERQCTVCNQFMDSLDLVEKHMVSAHSVRSDLITYVAFKHCNNCDGRYFNYSTHNCPKSPKNSSCQFCCRKFATKPLLVNHTQSPYNNHIVCRICGKLLRMKCQEMEHVSQKHSQNYTLIYKCTMCTDECKLYLDEPSIVMHRISRHNKRADNRRSYYEMMLVPRRCLDAYIIEEDTQTDVRKDVRNVRPKDIIVDVQKDERNVRSKDIIIAKTSESALRAIQDSNDEEIQAMQVLSADIDVIVDEVDIKQERVYDENGEIDYEEMLKNMFSDTANNAEKRKDVKHEISKDAINEIDTKNNIKLCYVNETSKSDKPNIKDVGETSKSNKHNIRDVGETSKSNKQNIKDVGETSKSNKQNIKDVGETSKSDKQNIKDVGETSKSNKQNIKDVGETSKSDKQNIKDVGETIKSNEEIHMENNEDYSNVQIKTEPSDVDITENPVEISQIKSEPVEEEIETLTVKVDPNIDMEDIETGNISIKTENLSDDESTDVIPIEQLLKFNNVDWVSDINPDEMTVDIINPNGIYKRQKLYACSKCGYTAKHKHYSVHIESGCVVSPGINDSHMCTKCGLTFVMFRNYVLHFDKHGYNAMACPKCGDTFDQQVKLLSHVQRHIKNSFVGLHVLNRGGEESSKMKKEVKCQECREAVPHSYMFRHWESHLILKPEGELETEITEFIIKEEDTELTVNCERVTNTKKLDPTTLKTALESLQSITLTEKNCAVCYRSFTRRCDVKRHIVEHLLMDAHVQKFENKGFRCQICGELFYRPEQYKFHMREHGCMPIFKCELCNKTFSDSSNFAKHKKIHGVRVLICDICEKKFHSKIALQKHIMEHSETKQFPCPFCAASFSVKRDLKKHKYRLHAKFRCVLCDLSFETLQRKWNHDWEVHKERKSEADCPICGQSYRKLQDVKQHARTQHNVVLTTHSIVFGNNHYTYTNF